MKRESNETLDYLDDPEVRALFRKLLPDLVKAFAEAGVTLRAGNGMKPIQPQSRPSPP